MLRSLAQSWLRRWVQPHRPASPLRRRAARPTVESLEERELLAASLNDTFVATLYQSAVGRQASADELSWWDSLFAQGATREQVAGAVLALPEAETRAVQQRYDTLLGHDGDAATAGYYVWAL